MSLHPKTCLFTNRSSSNACIMGLPKLTSKFILVCATFLSPYLVGNTICSTFAMASVPDLSKCNASRVSTVQLTGNVTCRHLRVPQWSPPQGSNVDMPRTRLESNCMDNHQPREYFYSSARTSQGSTCTQAC